ncbi:Omega-amidase YafV [Flavobacterium bizetiae]|uniref:Omega-amidase YafV n=1 Tax=Flavobacterium bizetiae TaxID=2704140 RepID=A0A6J4GLB7_9FLAO|nr:nitrilase family protein [Flavobacterium bizetiae]CAA9199080.1 Omega-amidase YafV [Flavobacterium bizetiae]CAD5341780.1 Omega-amidase YafV [Flavobacterium bizetiae]CAD5347528.1 Omega-amidase YafV [Flavobacterium bizetiae]
MKIAIIQSDLYWEDASRNRKNFESKINQIDSEVNLVVLPEMFSTGFTMNAVEVAETMKGETVLWLQSLAKQKNFAITGSLIIVENEKYYNRMLFVFPSGEIQYYDKRHLFSLAGEDKFYTNGNKKVIVEYLDWKICLQVCYDLRFPVFARNVENYDLLLYVANWPKVRTNAWDSLLKARAIENLSYVVGVNRVGLDANNYEHIGHSQAIDFLGNFILEPQESEAVFIVELDKKIMLETREKLDFLSDKDIFEIKI